MTTPIADTLLDPMYAEYMEEQKPVVKSKKRKKLTKAEKEERKRKQEIEFKQLEMRDEMRREYEMSKKTARKYRERWEEMCRAIKLKQMKKELEDWEEKVSRVMKQKDEKIELILDDIAITEEIRKKTFSTQIQIMDYLIDTLKTFQEHSQLLYEDEVSEILHDFYRELDQREAVENSIKLNCESVAHATQLLTEQELLSDYQIFLEKRDDYVCKEIEKRYQYRDAITKKMQSLRKQLLEFRDSLMHASIDPHKYERIDSLMERQRNFLVESNKLNDTEQRSSRIYTDLQRDLVREEREFKQKINDLKLEHDYFMKMRKNIEKEMKLSDERTHEKLKIVTSESFKALKKYQKLVKFGELLLSLAANCRKFQTQSEKVLPWGDFQESRNESVDENESFQLEVIDLKEHVDISEAELQNNAQLMRHFWRRQAIAEAEIVILEEKKRQLLMENQNYIDTIKRLSKADNAEDLKETLQVESVACFRN